MYQIIHEQSGICVSNFIPKSKTSKELAYFTNFGMSGTYKIVKHAVSDVMNRQW